MSKEFRQKILNEFTQTFGKKTNSSIRAARERWVKDYFDRGQLRVTNKNWVSTWSEVASNLPGGPLSEFSIIPEQLEGRGWKKIHNHIVKKFKDKSIINPQFVTYEITYTPQQITIKYVRGTKRQSYRNQQTIDLEKYVSDRLRIVMENFFQTGDFKDISQRILDAALDKTEGTGQTLNHGDTLEPFFGQSNKMVNGMPMTNTRIMDSRQKDVKEIAGNLKSGKTTAPGAKGTLVSKRFLVALIKGCTDEFRQKQWFTQVHEAIDAKWAELFGYSSSVTTRDTKEKVQDNIQLSAELIATKYTNKFNLNKGDFDKALSLELQLFLKDNDYFASELVRLKKANAEDAAKLSSGSDTTVARMEKAAIKLAATNVLENIQAKSIKKRKKVQRSKKKGTSRTKAKFKSGSAVKRKTTRANVGGKRRGRPTKQAQAIGGNVLALKELINKILPDAILAKMQSPALVNRTGRFRRSAEVTNAMIGPRGGVQIDYTYARNPYEVFEPGSGSPLANQYRDPRAIIGGTVREIAQSIMGKKFVRVRRV